MQYITTTELRTKSKDLVNELFNGKAVKLIHRSKAIGKVVPNLEPNLKVIDSKRLQKKIDALDFPRITLKEMDRRYRYAMMKKHGKGLS